MNNHPGPNSTFLNLVEDIGGIGRKKHESGILGNAEKNLIKIRKSIKDLPKAVGPKAMASMVISGGPSVLRRKSIEKLKELEFQGSIISADASCLSCLRRGLIPDYVVTLKLAHLIVAGESLFLFESGTNHRFLEFLGKFRAHRGRGG